MCVCVCVCVFSACLITEHITHKTRINLRGQPHIVWRHKPFAAQMPREDLAPAHEEKPKDVPAKTSTRPGTSITDKDTEEDKAESRDQKSEADGDSQKVRELPEPGKGTALTLALEQVEGGAGGVLEAIPEGGDSERETLQASNGGDRSPTAQQGMGTQIGAVNGGGGSEKAIHGDGGADAAAGEAEASGDGEPGARRDGVKETGLAEEVQKLARLRADGLLTDAEFDAAKAKVLGYQTGSANQTRGASFRAAGSMAVLAALSGKAGVDSLPGVNLEDGVSKEEENVLSKLKIYYASVDDAGKKMTNGPVPFTEFKDLVDKGSITLNTRVWRKPPGGEWRKLGTDSELLKILAPSQAEMQALLQKSATLGRQASIQRASSKK